MKKMSGEDNFIKFLGTAGARFVMIKQLRASGGIWVSISGKNILIDPGPGSIVQCNKSRPKLELEKLDAIILTHRHLDHANDINVMIEAMTEGGRKKRGVVFCPEDALANDDSVILKHTRQYVKQIEVLRENTEFKIGDFIFYTSMRHIHPVETYGIKFKMGEKDVSFLSDTKYFADLIKFYCTPVIIICVVFLNERADVEHLSLYDVKQIIRQTNPEKVILTHFGMTMIRAKPHLLVKELSRELGVEVIAAYDGMSFRNK